MFKSNRAYYAEQGGSFFDVSWLSKKDQARSHVNKFTEILQTIFQKFKIYCEYKEQKRRTLANREFHEISDLIIELHDIATKINDIMLNDKFVVLQPSLVIADVIQLLPEPPARNTYLRTHQWQTEYSESMQTNLKELTELLNLLTGGKEEETSVQNTERRLCF